MCSLKVEVFEKNGNESVVTFAADGQAALIRTPLPYSRKDPSANPAKRIAGGSEEKARPAYEKALRSFHRLRAFSELAERVGFEPTCPCGQLDFESSSLRPLRYRSGSDIPMFALAAYPQGGPVMTAFFGAEPALRFSLCHTFSKVASPVRKEFSCTRQGRGTADESSRNPSAPAARADLPLKFTNFSQKFLPYPLYKPGAMYYDSTVSTRWN